MTEIKRTNMDSEAKLCPYDAMVYMIRGILKGVNTAEVVKVINVNNDGTIDVLPLVSDVDSEDEKIEPTPAYNVKYIKWQAGENMIDITPEKDDIGLLIVCTKDISNIGGGIIASFRRYNLSDGIYIGGLFGFNKTPTQYIKFDENGIEITSPTAITVSAKNVNVIGEQINLGGEGGAAVARVGDSVIVGGTTGSIVSGSSIVNAT